MNLRSVFTVEQQRILQRYYENGMTNQSKNCFQLILQCAQETKLDFSVVRTWVGNKRRKMSSKNSESGTATTGTSLSAPDITVRNVVNITRPSSQQSSWTSANNDVIVTGIYSPANSSSRQGTNKHTDTQITEAHKIPMQKTATKNDTEFQLHIPVQRQVAHCKNASLLLGEKTIILSRQTSVLNAGNSVFNHTKKNYGNSSVQASEMTVPQKSSVCHRPYKIEPVGIQRSYKPEHTGPALHNLCGQKPTIRDPYCRTQNLEIREVFSLAVSDYPQRILGGNAPQKPSSAEGNCLSIAMETGDAEDEYAREEELASMRAQIPSYSRFYESGSSLRAENQSTTLPGPGRNMPNSQMVNIRDMSDSVLYQNRNYHLTPRTSLHTASSTIYSNTNPLRSNFSPHFASSNQLRLSQNQNNYQISGNLTVPWITGCSRKRALQDRTQFSDRDLATLKKYWDNGMTSLGSVCREKIEAVATELNVDCEIVRTWIGNRRRKYRLMGIEVPPPRGGPADFSEQPESGSLSALTPGEEAGPEVGEDNDRNDEVSICLSEGSSQEEPNEVVPNEARAHKEEDHHAVSTDNVKIEIIDDEESDMISNSEVEQVNSLLDYKNEEVKFIENELEIQKQKYFKLQTFVRSLILAMKADDKEQQQALLSDLPPELEEMDFNHASLEPDDTSFSVSSLSEKNVSESL
ncbi:highly divergent homeobox isoform X2 [Macaca nemestrina]|uniref:Highly divergent homeobox n=4 Tax=Macaca TaxID=9539 RepID=F7D8D4_MACMU|nr:highly divergent homeobox isoform X1 [Macaca nemestrina]XP_011742908.1 highly divergent homeobox isoform X1 [Macaca nemestrina]XP_011742909.1 highly divergent homeobox isoform X1 [Macaca nemestrina]XP_014983226.1 highly divergent homeobox isoform X1 [Macaca mulatta]XP_024649113.1 highly divergent homeobox isoform X1 [Macaca nemestrina]XP_028698381.1 highly divergent homeobox isoform X1 [Macaca mulatta]XP_050632302.1 highly divergent homeobox isoform X1 [Macaca thibetana thibetana]XP_05063